MKFVVVVEQQAKKWPIQTKPLSKRVKELPLQ
jgi:hypothetical protein